MRAALLLGLAALAASAQPTIRTTTRLVTVNVVVRDRNGPVTGLTKNDFALFDGKRRDIAAFAVETSNSAPSAAALPVLPPNVFTNAIERAADTRGSLTVILFDGLNTPITDQFYARRQLIKFLAGLRPDDRVALYSLGRTLEVIHDFTSDRLSLSRMLTRYRGRLDRDADPTAFVNHNADIIRSGPPGDGEIELDRALANMNQQMIAADTVTRVRTTMQAMEAIANHVAPLPGRKNLVWISAAFPLTIGFEDPNENRMASRENFRTEISRVSRALNSADVAVYPVDARGLLAAPPPMAPQQTTMFRAGTGASNAGTASAEFQRTGQDAMNDMANYTGGKAWYNTNDIAGAVRNALDDTQVTYVLGFYPEEKDLDGRYHPLKVQTPDRKGLTLRFRQGYYAVEKDPPPDQVRRAAFDRAIWSPIESTGISFAAQVVRAADAFEIRVLAEARNITLTPKDDRWQGGIFLLVAQLDEKGRVLAASNDPIGMALKKETVDQGALPFGKSVKIAPGVSQLRIVIMDRPTGTLGSVIVPAAKI